MWDSLCFYLGTGVRWRLRRQHAGFLRAVHDCRAVQHRTLQRLLALNAGSEFSAAHSLQQVRSVEQLRRHLPISGYDEFAPYIDRVKSGHETALLGRGNRLLMFALSSGTTATTKFIPVTRTFLRDYRHGWQMWGIRAFDDHPRLFRSHVFQVASDYDKFRTDRGIPCGNISGLVQRYQNPLVRQMYSIPRQVLKITDPLAKYYVTLRFAMADNNLGLVMTANPSTLIQLARLMQQHAQSLLRDLHDGTLSPPGDLPPALLRSLNRRLTRLPHRARELARAGEHAGELLPKNVWPDLALIAVWTGGTVGGYLPLVRRYYGEVPIRDHGLSASEGRMTIPLEDNSSSGVLDIASHFFEFVPEGEIDSAQPTALEAHQLQQGKRYNILLTTASGLYRYNIHDVVECTGFLGTTPLLTFLHKGAHISSLTGEKLSESQVIAAVSRATALWGIHLEHFVLSPTWGDPPQYQLWLEEELGDRAQSFLAALDRELQQENPEYADKRRTGRIGSVQLMHVRPGTWEQWARHRQAQPGGSAEQYKHPFLVPDVDFASEMKSALIRPAN